MEWLPIIPSTYWAKGGVVIFSCKRSRENKRSTVRREGGMRGKEQQKTSQLNTKESSRSHDHQVI